MNQSKLIVGTASALAIASPASFAAKPPSVRPQLEAMQKVLAEQRARRPSDYRRGSTRATANRETNAARDLSDGIYSRRARLGVEGIFAAHHQRKATGE